MKGLQPSREPGGPGGAAPSKPLVEQTEPVDFSSRCPDDAAYSDNDDYGDIGGDNGIIYESIATVGEIRVYWRDDFQSGSRVLKKVF